MKQPVIRTDSQLNQNWREKSMAFRKAIREARSLPPMPQWGGGGGGFGGGMSGMGGGFGGGMGGTSFYAGRN